MNLGLEAIGDRDLQILLRTHTLLIGCLQRVGALLEQGTDRSICGLGDIQRVFGLQKADSRYNGEGKQQGERREGQHGNRWFAS